ncbi:hypothetical protein BGW80DRAFT_1258640, partial [Lactifluus volemus]
MLETNARAIRVGRGVSVGNADRGGVPASEQTLVSAASGAQICEAWATVTPSTLNVLRVEASKETQGDENGGSDRQQAAARQRRGRRVTDRRVGQQSERRKTMPVGGGWWRQRGPDRRWVVVAGTEGGEGRGNEATEAAAKGRIIGSRSDNNPAYAIRITVTSMSMSSSASPDVRLFSRRCVVAVLLAAPGQRGRGAGGGGGGSKTGVADVVVVVGLQLRSQVQMALQGRQGEVADVALVKVVAGQRRRSEVGTVEGITSVSKDASTHLPVKRLGREPEASRFADADADNILDFWASFTLRVLR